MSDAKEIWYVYAPGDGVHPFTSEDAALKAARLKIEEFRDRRRMEWFDGVDGIMVVKRVCGVKDASHIPEHEDWRLEIDLPDTPQG